jgi:hypothetical protein
MAVLLNRERSQSMDKSVLLAGQSVVAVACLLLSGGVAVSANGPGTFQPVGKSTYRGLENAVVLRDGSVLITGGGRPTDTGFVTYASAERFDPATNTFSAVMPMTTPRQAHAAVLLQDGRVLILGGWDGQNSLNSAELFDPVTGSFSLTGPMAQVRSGPSATG